MVLRSIVNLLSPSWEYYLLAKGRMATYFKVSESIRYYDPSYIDFKINQIIDETAIKYDCKIEVYEQFKEVSGQDYITGCYTVVLKLRSNFE